MAAPDRKRLTELGYKWLEKKISSEEKQEFERWLDEVSDEPLDLYTEARTDKAYEALLFKKIQEQTRTGRSVTLWPRIAAAASILVALSLGAYLVIHKKDTLQIAQNQKQDVAPGSQNAILKVGNGKSIILSNRLTGTLAKLGGMTINKTGSGTIAYNGNPSALAHDGKVTYDTLINPAGSKIYYLNLPDGSKLKVNAATTLVFPENFAANRNVKILKGEAYFDVKYNAVSLFTTTAKNQTITDLGTHFNVSAYDDEPNSVVTLVEGSIKLNKGSKIIKLVPGQQAISAINSPSIQVKNVDPEDAIAWTTGNFMFDGESLGEAMKKVSRWYDVEVVYDDPKLADQIMGGGITMFTNVSKVLEALQKASSVHFKIEGRKITVMK